MERNIHCLKEEYYFQEDEKESAERKACQFRRSWLKECSGLQDRTFGYSEGRPCILLKMNRVREAGGRGGGDVSEAEVSLSLRREQELRSKCAAELGKMDIFNEKLKVGVQTWALSSNTIRVIKQGLPSSRPGGPDCSIVCRFPCSGEPGHTIIIQ